MRKLNLTLVLLGAACLLMSCGGGSSLQPGEPGVAGDRYSNATEADPFVTELIAGAGQGWPGTGIDVGEVQIWNDDDDLHVTYVLDAAGWYFGDDDLHLWVGTAAPPPPVAPGQFPFKASPDSTEFEYEFVLPLVGDYPARGNDDPVPYDWTDENLYIAAHGVVCQEVGGGGVPVQGVFANWDLYYGSTEIDAGWVTLAIEGNNLVVTIGTDSPWTLVETHLYVGTIPPAKFAPGQWTDQHSPLPPGTTTDSYTVPLGDIPAGPEDTLYIAIHATIFNTVTGASESALSWDPNNWEKWKDNNWKRYSWFDVPPGGGEYEVCETMWGLDPIDGYDGVSANEPGWFPTFYEGGVKKWGWVFHYLVN